MNKELPSVYDHTKIENKIYKLWEKSGFFNPDKLPRRHKTPFSMVLPPPNVTGTLHIGHALTVAIEDAIIRFQRMRGKRTLWLPGTDHASIATETKFLKETNSRKSDYEGKREEFIRLVDKFAKKNQQIILDQLRKMGASLDWSRLAYTLDKKRQSAVYSAFEKMFNEGLIYYGEHLVNWDIKGQTTVSDDEVVYENAQGVLYTFKYAKDFPVPIATTRPETKLGDVAVAVHPNDKWKQYIGQKFEIKDFAGVKLSIEIVGDKAVDPVFGTGAVGITPAHSKIDREIAQRHNLPLNKQVINEYGKIINVKPEWNEIIGVKEAREKIIQWLRDNQLLEKEEIIEHNIARAQRSGGIIEILPKRHQFFVNVNKAISARKGKTLKDLMRDTVVTGKIKIIPKYFEKTYFHWIDNLRDWNISRQIWYGHKIPAWYRDDEIKIGLKSPGKDWQPVNNTFDTWFSSGLWTFSTLGWPDKTSDLKIYHPTNVLETGYDILFFWVARMILMSSFLLDETPFRVVFLHGLVRDEQRRKMSKSLGNVIDPLVMTEKYGTDALRIALVFNAAPGADSVLSEDKIKGMKHFANKIWNASRFVISNTKDFDGKKPKPNKRSGQHLSVLKRKIQEITKDLENYRFHLAAEKIYHYFWHIFCDKIIEESKVKLQSQNEAERKTAQFLLLETLTTCLKTLHPFMPFITEEIYQKLPLRKKEKCLMIEQWPKS